MPVPNILGGIGVIKNEQDMVRTPIEEGIEAICAGAVEFYDQRL